MANGKTILTLRPYRDENRPTDGFFSKLFGETIEVPIQDHDLSLEEAQNLVDDGKGNKWVERVPLFDLADGCTIDLLLNEEGKLVGLNPALILTRGGEIVDIVLGNVAFVKATPEGHWRPLDADELFQVHERLVTGLADVAVGDRLMRLFIPVFELEV